jgi:hypothetical protein
MSNLVTRYLLRGISNNSFFLLQIAQTVKEKNYIKSNFPQFLFCIFKDPGIKFEINLQQIQTRVFVLFFKINCCNYKKNVFV